MLLEQDGVIEAELRLARARRVGSVALLAWSAGVDAEPHDPFGLVALRSRHERPLEVRVVDVGAVRIEPLEHDRLPLVVGEVDRVPVGIGEREIGRRLANLGGGRGGAADGRGARRGR
jgi:hypothetical protein